MESPTRPLGPNNGKADQTTELAGKLVRSAWIDNGRSGEDVGRVVQATAKWLRIRLAGRAIKTVPRKAMNIRKDIEIIEE